MLRALVSNTLDVFQPIGWNSPTSRAPIVHHHQAHTGQGGGCFEECVDGSVEPSTKIHGVKTRTFDQGEMLKELGKAGRVWHVNRCPQHSLAAVNHVCCEVEAEGGSACAALNRKMNPLTCQTEIVPLHGGKMMASVNEGCGTHSFARAMTFMLFVAS